MSATIHDGPFYAYIHHIRDDNHSRFVIIFASRDDADNWWRAISNAKDSSGRSLDVQRIAPQFYTHDTDRFNVSSFFTDSRLTPISRQFRGKLFFQLEQDRGGRGISIIPPQIIVDHTSGSWFTIRSKSDSTKYWYHDPSSGRVVASDSRRSHFKVSALGVPDNTIMIGGDEIRILSEYGGFLASYTTDPALTLSWAETGPVNTFKFEELRLGSFAIVQGLLSYSEKTNLNACAPFTWELAL